MGAGALSSVRFFAHCGPYMHVNAVVADLNPRTRLGVAGACVREAIHLGGLQSRDRHSAPRRVWIPASPLTGSYRSCQIRVSTPTMSTY